MSQSASQAAVFYREIAEKRVVWGIRDAGGFPAPKGTGGKRAMPFWSSKARAQKIIETVAAYAGFEPAEISWTEFEARWIPGLTKDKLLIGVNWSGERATGYDIKPSELKANVEAAIKAL